MGRLSLCIALILALATTQGFAADVYGPREVVRAPVRVPLALRTLSYQAAAVLASDPCWRSCTAQCGWQFQGCLRVVPFAGCLAHNNACDLACLRQCRITGGPFVGGAIW